jgi:hypothetical protein
MDWRKTVTDDISTARPSPTSAPPARDAAERVMA